MTRSTVDPSLCPLCANPNACAMVDGGKSCWCFSTAIARDAIERVPIEQRGLACICRQCGTSFDQQPTVHVPETDNGAD